MKEAALLLREGKRMFMVLDEMFRGTNVRDAHDATRAVVAAFARSRNGLFLVSSHLAELAEDFAPVPSIQLRCFDAEIRDGSPAYDYTLKDGFSTQRLGLLLLEQERVLDLLRDD
ncbi:MAG TPA: hypothetical protein VHG51_05285 [Longimicrobiaceae bacterium]|nr:hypothetical protein [Longimicrobiaceae bacterium]